MGVVLVLLAHGVAGLGLCAAVDALRLLGLAKGTKSGCSLSGELREEDGGGGDSGGTVGDSG